MTFLAPYMLVFVGAGVIPLVLHWLSRSRQVELRWGAMMFLEDVSPRRSKLHRLRQAVVLLLRCLAVVLLAVALARPVVGVGYGGGERLPDTLSGTSSPWRWLGGLLPQVFPSVAPAPAGTAAPAPAVLLVLDTSGSTSAPAGPTATRISEIKEAASRVITRLDGREQLALMTAPPASLQVPFTTDHAQVAARLPLVAAGSALLDLEQTLRAAADTLAAVQAGGRTLVLLTDRQAAMYRDLNPATRTSLREQLARAGVGRFVVVTPGGADRDNVAVRGIEVADPYPLTGRPLRIRVLLHNHGPTPRPRLAVYLSASTAEGVALGAETRLTVDLGPDAAGQAETELTFPVVGPVVLTARIDASGATFDDTAWAVVHVRDRARVLLVDTLPGPLSIALAPETAAGRPSGSDRLVVSRTDEGRLPVFDLERYAAVVVPHLQRLDRDEARAIVQYVYGGGGLVLGVGPLTPPESTSLLSELLPAAIGPPTPPGDPPRRVLPDSAAPIDLWAAHVASTAPPDGQPDLLPGGVVERHVLLQPTTGQTVLRTSLGAPLAVLGRFGAGRVLLVGTPLEGPWNDLYRSVGYVPTVQAMALSVLAAEPETRPIAAGERLSIRLPVPTADPARLRLDGPLGPLRIERIDRTPDAVIVRTEAVYDAGVVRLRLPAADPASAGVTVPAIVMHPAAESDLTPGDELQRRTVSELGGVLFRSVAEVTSADLRPGRELWFYVLLLAAACLGVETLLTRRWDL